ncbi:putative metal-dependent phosphohydrolase [Streptomyces clavuligerus]|uniref:Putative metal-dependent phosphohydrolase n=3 Tax=Streptomyces clavuligerus TaxID=1901 RepID=E2Q1J7_STRCL|nr:putative metal-dependent phosphohydrolase [Streptomyces clavuligerus]
MPSAPGVPFPCPAPRTRTVGASDDDKEQEMPMESPTDRPSRGAPGAAGVAVPDSALAREATELIRDTTGELIYHHSRRVYFFGSLQARGRGLAVDPELLYVGALFHDVGLGEAHRGSGRRFEIDGAEEAAAFLRAHGMPEEAVRRVWTAIALHTTPEIPAYLEPEVAALTAGVEYDVLGIGFDGIGPAERAEITALHPRPDFKRRILAAFTEGVAPKPETTFGNVKADVLAHFVPGFRRGDFVEVVRASPWPE